MKNILLRILTMALSICIIATIAIFPASASENNSLTIPTMEQLNEDGSLPLGLSFVSSEDYTADQATLDALYQEHLELREDIAQLSSAQTNFLLALGYPEDAVSTITNGEVADLLKSGEVIKPEYLANSIDYEQLTASLFDSMQAGDNVLKEMGLTENQIIEFNAKGLVPWEYDKTDTARILQDIARPVASHRSTSCHVFAGQQALEYLDEDNVHFHSASYPRVIYDGGDRINLPLKPIEGTLEYDIKMAYLSGDLYDVSSMVDKLYVESSGVSYHYNLWTEETSGKYHEGIDTFKSPGSALMSISDGTIIQKVAGSSTTLSKLLVYNSTYDVTIQYLHGAWTVGGSGSIKANTPIGSEDRRGAVGPHTHVQIVDGSSTNVPAQDASIGTLRPYNYISMF